MLAHTVSRDSNIISYRYSLNPSASCLVLSSQHSATCRRKSSRGKGRNGKQKVGKTLPRALRDYSGRSGVRTKLDRSYPKLVRPKILVVHKLIVPNTGHYQKLVVQRRVVQRLAESKTGCTKDRSPQIQVVPKTACFKDCSYKGCSCKDCSYKDCSYKHCS